jgi:hypothetical protein
VAPVVPRSVVRAQREEAMRSAVITAVLAAAAVSVGAHAASAIEVKFMTGPQGGFWVPLGGALKDMWEKNVKDLKVQNLPGAGVANVRGIEEDKADIGLGNTITTVDALTGAAPFTKPHKNVCNLASLYPQYMQVVVRASSGINSVKDIKGKVLTTLPRGNTTEVAAQHILKVNGLSYTDMKVNFGSLTDAVTQMQDGHSNMMIVGTSIPAGGIMDLAAGRDVKVLDLAAEFAEMKKINPGYVLNAIPANTYPKQDKELKVPGFDAHLVVSCKLPEDVVYGMAKTMLANVSSLAAVAKAMGAMTVKSMSQDVGVPFHPGAVKFYKEQGISVK